MDQENVQKPGTVVAPTVGDTLNGSNGPVESTHQHEASEKAYASATLAKAASNDRDVSPIEAAHSSLLKNQISLHEKLMLLAGRLEHVLARPLKGDETVKSEDSYGSSPVAQKLANSSSMTNASHNVVDHLLNNLEV